jgi:putative transposase
MTNDRMALAELLEKGSDSDLLREMISYVAQRLMDVDVAGLVGLVGADHGERAESRENWRTGYD